MDALCLAAHSATPATPLSDLDEALRSVDRIGFGARPPSYYWVVARCRSCPTATIWRGR